MVSTDFRWANLASGYYGARTAFFAYQQPQRKFSLDQLFSSVNLVISINRLFSELVARPSLAEKVVKHYTYGLLVLHGVVVLVMHGTPIDPSKHQGEDKAYVQFWKYSSKLLAVTDVALVIMTSKQNRARAVAYVTTLALSTLKELKKLPKAVVQRWSYTTYVAIAFTLYDGNFSQRTASFASLAMMLLQKGDLFIK